MDEDTKMTNPEIMDEGFQPIGKEDGLSWCNIFLCSGETQEPAIEHISLLVPRLYGFAIACFT